MNGTTVLFTAVIVVNAAACLTPRPPAAPPTRFAGPAAEVKSFPSDATAASQPVALPARCMGMPAEAKAAPSSATIVGTDNTTVDVKRWLYVTFFNRVKARVVQHWHPAEAYRSHNPEGTIQGGQILTTRLQVYLWADGSLDRVAIDCSSGLDFLDNLALEAFEKAQPFINPPRRLVGDNGKINFGFGFVFNTAPVAAGVRDAGPSQ